MSVIDYQNFIARIPPFDRLSDAELRRFAETADIAYFNPGECLVEFGQAPEHLYIVVRGSVHEINRDGEVTVHGEQDLFDAAALLKHECDLRFVVHEELICYLLPRAVFVDIARNNQLFADFFFQGISRKLDALVATQYNQELSSFMVARIEDAYIHPPLTVPASVSIRDAAITMRDSKATSLLVDDGDQIGIVTGKDLREAVIINRGSVDDPVGALARYELIEMDQRDYLFAALLAMTRHEVHRVVVRRDGEIVGVLEQMDLISFFSNQSHLVAIQIERARSRQDLQEACSHFSHLVKTLTAKGVKWRYIAQLLSELNTRLMQKLFELIAPEALRANSCLLVMGSEGREEQILKTDQDNALILRDGFDFTPYQDVARLFTETLVEFGYPPCPGGIMITNPQWARPLTAFKHEVLRWSETPISQHILQLTILADGKAVAGDSALWEELRAFLHGHLAGRSAFFTNFASPVLNFDTPLGIFKDFVVHRHNGSAELDIKKGGIFPIIHGIRALALQHGLGPTNTIERIKALRERGLFDKEFAVELIESFAFMSSLRVKSGLEELRQGRAADNLINPASLTKMERDLLKDAFKIVNQFKKLITYHYKLDLAQ